MNNNNNTKHKAEYTSKETKKRFLKWYLNTYGMNTSNTVNTDTKYNKNINSRILSEQFQQVSGILIPKMSIYRWLKRLDNIDAENKNDNKFQDVIDEYVDVYINNNCLEQVKECFQ